MVEFNNGFITAIALFLEHKNFTEQIIFNRDSKVIYDLRLYGAVDHLYDMEIPKSISEKLRKKILNWRKKCFTYRLEHFDTTKVTDGLFKEAEDILAKIDFLLFKTKKVRMNYR